MEEPVCEPPAVAMYYVSKLARNFVKVLISGEGGDEAFGGYPNLSKSPVAGTSQESPRVRLTAVRLEAHWH